MNHRGNLRTAGKEELRHALAAMTRDLEVRWKTLPRPELMPYCPSPTVKCPYSDLLPIARVVGQTIPLTVLTLLASAASFVIMSRKAGVKAGDICQEQI